MPSSPLPCTNCAGRSRVRMRASVSRIMGPGTMSPPNTMRSTGASPTSSSTASNAGRFAWMSHSTATRMTDLLQWRDSAFPEIPGARVFVGVAHAKLGLVGLDICDRAAERDGLRLGPGVDVEIDTAANHVGDRGRHDHGTMPAHQAGGPP